MQMWVLLRSNKIYLKDCPWTYLEHKSIRTLSRWLYCSQRNTLSPLHLMLGLLMWNWLLLSIYDLLKMQACLYMHVTCWGEFKGKNVQVCVLSHFSHVWLCAAPQTVACQAPPVHGILPARILEWMAISYSRICPWHRDQTCASYVSCLGRWDLYPLVPPGKSKKVHTL